MLDKSYYNDSHLTELAFLMLEVDELSPHERELVAAHLASCDKCMAAFTDSLSDEFLVDPPDGMEDRILASVDCENQNHNKQSKVKFMILQFTKLAVAVSIMMVLFIGGAFDFATELSTIPHETHLENSSSEKSQNILIDINNAFSDSFNKFAFKFNNYGNK